MVGTWELNIAKSKFGRGVAVNWPTGTGSRGSSGVAATVSQTPVPQPLEFLVAKTARDAHGEAWLRILLPIRPDGAAGVTGSGFIVLAATTTFLGFAVLTFLPVFTKSVFQGDARTYSHLLAFSGSGSVVGALIVLVFSLTAQNFFTPAPIRTLPIAMEPQP